jgi:hypothetical protein
MITSKNGGRSRGGSGWLGTERTHPTGQKKNRPTPPGDWEFVPGPDLSDPGLGQPDPSNFFLIRQIWPSLDGE